MSGNTQKPKLLIVDTSTSMAQVLNIYAKQENYQADVFSDPAEACIELDRQADKYQCVVLGWPEGKMNIVADLISKLSEADHAELPLVIISQEESAVADTLSKHRSNTRTLLWKNYRQTTQIVDDMTAFNMSDPVSTASSVLLVSHTRAACRELVSLLEAENYQVTQSSNLAQAKAALHSNLFDLVVSDYKLPESSAKELCEHLMTLEPCPAYAFMADENLDDAVKNSLALGALTCFDKTVPTAGLFDRVNTIVKGLPQRAPSKVSKPVIEQVLVPLAGMLEMTEEPALLIDDGQQIVGANRLAMDIVAPNESNEIFREISATRVLGDWLNLTQTKPESGKFSSISGDQFTVEYRLKKLEGKSLGLEGDHYLLTFMVLDSAPVEVLPVVSTEAPRAVSRAPSILTPSALEQAIDSAVLKRKGTQVVSVLMLDIKMKAAVTGDRLSLGSSEPLLEIVKENFLLQYPRENSLAYLGKGRFGLLIQTPRVEQALNLSKKIVDSVPGLVNNAVDVELVSHAAFLRMPEHSSMTADLLLKHCTAACLKTAADGKDNSIYVIGKEPWQKSVSSQQAEAEEFSVLDIGIPDMPTSFRRTRSADVTR